MRAEVVGRGVCSETLVVVIVAVVLTIDVAHASQAIFDYVSDSGVGHVCVAVIMHDFFLRKAWVGQLWTTAIFDCLFDQTCLPLPLTFIFLCVVLAWLLSHFESHRDHELPVLFFHLANLFLLDLVALLLFLSLFFFLLAESLDLGVSSSLFLVAFVFSLLVSRQLFLGSSEQVFDEPVLRL